MSSKPPNPIEERATAIDICLGNQLELCRRLETLVDALPFRFDTLAATLLAERLRSTMQMSHHLEETIIFPALSTCHPEIHGMLDRLREEHLEDQDQTRDVQDAVGAFALGNRGEAEAVGYMVRCLFVSLRRHLAHDREYILPLYRKGPTSRFNPESLRFREP
ncbi:hemerythrin domain-containing protein [Oceaniglobus indicus]|uniref:hemerythrin domain-containing protein n=1 Tax=Oceaniglobus indicus TaxID=2047749 RepID=UPI001F4D603A|nr:hemerythrin domain-containing protein [Oceaniglobus indicus]